MPQPEICTVRRDLTGPLSTRRLMRMSSNSSVSISHLSARAEKTAAYPARSHRNINHKEKPRRSVLFSSFRWRRFSFEEAPQIVEELHLQAMTLHAAELRCRPRSR